MGFNSGFKGLNKGVLVIRPKKNAAATRNNQIITISPCKSSTFQCYDCECIFLSVFNWHFEYLCQQAGCNILTVQHHLSANSANLSQVCCILLSPSAPISRSLMLECRPAHQLSSLFDREGDLN